MAWTPRSPQPAETPRVAGRRRTDEPGQPAPHPGNWGRAARSSPAPPAHYSHGMPVVRLAELCRETRSEVLRVPLFSPGLGLRRWFALKLPPGYQPGQELPVIYLFRGHHFEWISPHEDSSRQDPLPGQFERAVREGRLPPAILIVPCMGSDDRQQFSIAVNWACPGAVPTARGMGLGRFEDYLIEDFFPVVERALGLYNPRRIAVGFSLGGLLAMELALRNPGFFSDVGTYDGSFFDDPVQADDAILSYGIFDPIFGIPRNPDLVLQHSPLHLASKVPVEELRRTRFYIQSGPQASEPNQSNYFRCKQVVEALAARGIENLLPQVLQDGLHNWHTADRFGMNILQLALARQDTASES